MDVGNTFHIPNFFMTLMVFHIFFLVFSYEVQAHHARVNNMSDL